MNEKRIEALPARINMSSTPSHGSLLSQIYGAVGQDAAWSVLVAQLCGYFQANIGMLVVAGQGAT
jgi:hypothetical protein